MTSQIATERQQRVRRLASLRTALAARVAELRTAQAPYRYAYLLRNLDHFGNFISKNRCAAMRAAVKHVPPPDITHVLRTPDFINGTMRDYQLKGLNWLLNQHLNGVGGLLADEMGLGKTLQMVAFLAVLKHRFNVTGTPIDGAIFANSNATH